VPTTQRRTTWIATAVWLATMGFCLVSAAMLLSTLWVVVPESWGFRGASTLIGATFGSVGAVVARRRPDNSIGWLFCAIGILFAIEGFIVEYTITGVLAAPGRLPYVTQIGWILAWIWVIPAGLALIYLPLLFPTGRLLSRRWRPVAWLGALSLAASAAIVSIAPGPISQATYIENPLGSTSMTTSAFIPVIAPAFIGFGLVILLALTSMIRRFATSTGEARLQIKWFAFAGAVAGALDVLYYTAFVVTAPPAITKLLEILIVVGLLSLPVAAGLAILRYRLYDIDRIISRTIAYAVVSGVLIATFVGAILAFQAVLSPVTRSNTLAVAASTLVVAALFQPLRRRVQTVVDRRFHRARYDAERTTSAFSERLRDQVDLAAVRSDLMTAVAGSLGPSSSALWLRDGSGTRE
jgi:hypothetical protein